jgi:hypothetical protein
VDDVVRVDGKWLIQTRNVAYQHPAPPPQAADSGERG